MTAIPRAWSIVQGIPKPTARDRRLGGGAHLLDRVDHRVEQLLLAQLVRRTLRAVEDIELLVERAGEEPSCRRGRRRRRTPRPCRPPYTARMSDDPDRSKRPEYNVYRSRRRRLGSLLRDRTEPEFRGVGSMREDLRSVGRRHGRKPWTPRRVSATSCSRSWRGSPSRSCSSSSAPRSSEARSRARPKRARRRRAAPGQHEHDPGAGIGRAPEGIARGRCQHRRPAQPLGHDHADPRRRRRAARLSIPRDTVVDIPGHGRTRSTRPTRSAARRWPSPRSSSSSASRSTTWSRSTSPTSRSSSTRWAASTSPRAACATTSTAPTRTAAPRSTCAAGHTTSTASTRSALRAHAQERLPAGRGRHRPRQAPAADPRRDQAPPDLAHDLPAAAVGVVERAQGDPHRHGRPEPARAVRRARDHRLAADARAQAVGLRDTPTGGRG